MFLPVVETSSFCFHPHAAQSGSVSLVVVELTGSLSQESGDLLAFQASGSLMCVCMSVCICISHAVRA